MIFFFIVPCSSSFQPLKLCSQWLVPQEICVCVGGGSGSLHTVKVRASASASEHFNISDRQRDRLGFASVFNKN